MNLYRGCTHNCIYCDGRAEKYRVDGLFGEDVEVKINAIDIFSRELDPKRKRKPFKQSYVMLGGGVGDSYQPIETTYCITRMALSLLYQREFPVHILTKSVLVMRDMDIIQCINARQQAILSFSFSSIDDDISAIVEPGVPLPSIRLSKIKSIREKGIACGMFLLPVIPCVTDSTEMIETAVQQASEVGIYFIIFGVMTLKEGRQKEYFLRKMETHYPELAKEYRVLYKDDEWGRISEEYCHELNKKFSHIAARYKMPKRIPPNFFVNILNENDRVIVMLEHLDYFMHLNGRPSPYGHAAYEISKLSTSLSAMKESLTDIRGVGATTARIIREILERGSCSLYDRLLTA